MRSCWASRTWAIPDMASVDFGLTARAFACPNPFRECWNMAKPKDNSSGWLVAGLQALA